MFCQKCGKENPDDAAFCNLCGAALNQPIQPVVTASLSPVNPPAKKHGILLWGAISIGIIFVVIIGAAVFATFTFSIAGNTQTTNIPKVTTIPTPSTTIPTVAPPQDPIIGVWMGSYGGTTIKIWFYENGTQSWLMDTPDKGSWTGYGSWQSLGNNTYITTEVKGGHFTYKYVPESNVIYEEKTQPFLYHPYLDNTKAASTVTESSSQSTTIYSTNGDVAAVDKMSEMNNWMSPTVRVIGDSLLNGNYFKAGLNAVLLRNYIDQNLPEMKQLANGAATKKAAAQEYVLYLEDMRSASNKVTQAADKYNSGDYAGSTNIANSGIQDLDSASAHFKQAMALL